MAERESSKRDIEEMVTQLKAKFDTTQLSLERSTELGRSTSDLSIFAASRPETPAHSAEAELRRKIRNLEHEVERYRESATNMTCNHTTEIQQLQHRILDLEENLREKESVIDARTQAVTLMSESLSQKTHSTVNLLEDTKVEMFKMQEAFVEKEKQLNGEIEELKSQLEEKGQEITNLQEVNDILETTRYDLTVKNAELSAQGENLVNLQARVDQLIGEKAHLEEEIDRLHAFLPNDDSGQSAEDFLAQFRANEEKIQKLEESLMQKTVECSVLSANFSVLQEKMKASGPKPLFASDRSEESDQEAAKLRTQLDDVNKSQIKMKLKMKQLQKQVDAFRKTSDIHQKVLELSEENEKLREKTKGRSEPMDDAEAAKQLKTLEATCQNQVAAIQLLEEQKIDLVDQVTKVREELEALKTAPVRSEPCQGISVSSQIDSIELEETIEQYAADKESLIREVEGLIERNEELKQKMQKLDEEKQELLIKLDQSSAEKQELLEKIDKLSIKNVSSVESLEIVENLTQQEQLEMEQQETGLIGEELSDSLMKLREESSELMNKIEMFTSERREIHQQYVEKIEELEKQVRDAESERNDAEKKATELEDLVQTSKRSVENLENQLQQLRTEFNEKLDENHNLSEENNNLKEKLVNLDNVLTTVEAQGSDMSVHMEKIAQLETEVTLKNETIETVNRQIMELYATLEEKNSQVLDKDDEITYLRDLHQTATDQLHQATHGNDQLKRLVDQLRRQLAEVEQKNARVANATDDVKIGLEKRIQELEDKVMDSEAKRREQLEKLKKFAANLKKKTQQCTDLEAEVIKRSEENDVIRKDYDEAVQRLSSVTEVHQAEVLEMQKILQDQKIEFSRKVDDMKNELIAKGAVVEELQRTLIQPREIEQLQNLLKDRDVQMQKLQEEVKNRELDLVKKVEGLQNEVDSRGRMIQELQGTLVQPQEVERVHNILKEREVQMQTLREEVKDREAKFSQKIEALQKEVDSRGRVVQELRETLIQPQKVVKLQTVLKEQDLQMQKLMQEVNDREKQFSEKIESLQNEVDTRGRVIQEIQQTRIPPEEIQIWQNQVKERDIQVLKLQQEVTDLLQKSSNVDSLKEDANKLKQSLEDAHRSYQEYARQTQEAFAEKEQRYLEMISSMEAKITEHQMYIEDKENENASLSTRINKLEEGISYIEARRNSLEKKNNILGDQLRESQAEFSENEDKLLQRLATLSANDEIIAEKLQNTHTEKMELTETIAELTAEKKVLENRLQILEQENAETQKKTEMQESEYGFLCQQIENQMGDMRKVQEDFERRLREKAQEIDDLEVESSNQLQKIEGEKKILQETLERTRDENSELQDEIMNLRENLNSLEQIRNDLERDYSWAKMQNETLNHDQLETQELRMQVVQDQTEIENLRQENQALRMSHECEVNSIKSVLDRVRIEKETLEAELKSFKEPPEKRANEPLTEAVAVAKEEKVEVDAAPQNIPSFMGAKFFAEDATSIDFFDQPVMQDAADDEYENRAPVVEELIIPKTAYICHPKTEGEVDLGGQEDDGWGWSAEEAVLEQEHQNQTAAPPSLLSQTSQIEVKLQMYEDRIQDLEAEKQSLKDEISQTRQKSEKMLKKLKEYRSKCESFERSSQSSLDLDLAIQEELRDQVKSLEAKLAAERKQMTAEVENLTKRVEVLSASNDRFVDLKEQQDSQVEMYRNQIKALTLQLQAMEEKQNDAWNTLDEDETKEGLSEEVQALQEEISKRDAKISELSDKISHMEDEAEQFVSQIDQFRMESAGIKDHLEKLTLEHGKLSAQEAEKSADTAKFEELQKMVQELQEERTHLSTELRTIREQAQVAEKSAQSLEQLKLELETLKQDKAAREAAFEEANRKWQEALEERGNSIAESWKAHLATVEADFAAREEALRQELLANPPKEDTPPKETVSAEHVPAGIADMMANMQNALESQELELVTLKEQLAIRSAEYAALSAQLDPFGHSATSNMALVQPKLIKTPPTSTGDVPPRTDLDLALYTLHQRDMRCEELTLELTRLLEERDTLQLKLSSAIRQIESMKVASPDGSPVANSNATVDSGSHLSDK